METPAPTKSQSGSFLNRPPHFVVTILLLSVLVSFLFMLVLPLWRQHNIELRYREVPESSLRDNLQRIRHAIARFHTDTGRYPVALQEIVATDVHHLRAPVKKGNSYKGPYFTPQGGINDSGIPDNPFTRYTDETLPLEVLINLHWRYDAKSGELYSALAGTTLDGRSYQSL